MDQLDHQNSFVCASSSRITWINGLLITYFKQIAPNKRQPLKKDSDADSDKKARYQDLHHCKLLKHH